MKTIRNYNLKTLAEAAGISSTALSYILSGKRRSGWKSAKGLSQATGTDPILWLEGSPEQIKAAIGFREGKACHACGRMM